MRIARPLLIAGVAVVALVGVAVAQEVKNTHELTVTLPGGGVEHIFYTGDVAPKVSMTAGPADFAAFSPFAPFEAANDPNSPFVMMQRIQAQMDRQMAAMMNQAPMVMAPGPLAAPGGLQEAAMAAAPAGAQSFSVISSFSGGHACTRSVETISQGAGKPPQVISKTSGDCAGTAAPSQGAPTIAAPQAAPAEPAAHVIQTKAPAPAPHAGGAI